MGKEKKTLNNLSLDELKTKSVEIEEQLFKLKMQKATGQLANTATIRMVRKELAQVRTFETQKLKAAQIARA
jgi:large subunit ribosomal protein L29